MRVMTYSASAHRLFRLGNFEKRVVKKEDNFLEVKGDSGDERAE